MLNITSAPLPEDSIGQTVQFEDDGCWGYAPRQTRTAVILGTKSYPNGAQYFYVEPLDNGKIKLVHQRDILGFCAPSLLNETAMEATEAAAIA